MLNSGASGIHLILETDDSQPLGEFGMEDAKVLRPQVIAPALLTEVGKQSLARVEVVAERARRKVIRSEFLLLGGEELVAQLSQGASVRDIDSGRRAAILEKWPLPIECFLRGFALRVGAPWPKVDKALANFLRPLARRMGKSR